MNKLYTIAGIMAMLQFNTFAQVVITTADLPMASQNYNIVQAAPIELADPALSAGLDMTWDYSNLQELTTDVLSLIPITETPFLYQFLFSQATHASAGADLNLGEMFSVTEVFNYYRNNATGYYDMGFGSSLSGFPLLGQRNPADRIVKLPLELGNEPDESSSYYQIVVPTLAAIRNWQTRQNVIDGWGTVTTPTGTFEALRVRSIVNAIDTIQITFEKNEIVQGITRPEVMEYRWYAPAMGVPVLQINTIDGQVTQVTYRGENSTIGVNEIAESSLKLFPNPTSNVVNFMLPENETALSVQTIDAAGRIVNNEFQFTGNQLTLNTSLMAAGMYQVMVRTNNGIFTGKLMVQR
jgi:hypothetical protein